MVYAVVLAVHSMIRSNSKSFPWQAKALCFVFLIAFHCFSQAQQSIKILVTDSTTAEPITGAILRVSETGSGAATDLDGLAILTLNDGSFHIVVSFIGYEDAEKLIIVPMAVAEIRINLIAVENETGEVIISSSRTNSRIDDLPSKIEVLGLEDMNEENGIKPGNIASIIGDLSVIHIQQTSSVSAGSVVRMQGLGGRYTQLLRDGLPVYDGFSGNLSIMQIPPLDLKQVEIVKGSASTLFGGGAISGLINLISKTPADSLEASLTLNQSSLNETNINSYFSKKKGRAGFTLFAGVTQQKPQDINKDGFSDVPQFQNVLAHPKLFFTPNKKTDISIGYSLFYEKRAGGDMRALNSVTDTLHTYEEKNRTQRQTGEFKMEYRMTEFTSIQIKSSWSQLSRLYERPAATLDAQQIIGYNEISILKKWAKTSLVGGVNYIAQNFDPKFSPGFLIGKYSFNTLGTFAQLTSNITEKLIVEAGARLDHQVETGNFLLPRISILFKPTKDLSVRLGSGFGYKVPDPFEYISTSDIRYYQHTSSSPKAERSIGVNNDIAYHTVIGEKLSLQIDQAFYYTRINPVLSSINVGESTELINNAGRIESYGTDSYVRLVLHPFELYLGYNHTQSTQIDSTGKALKLPFAPNDKFATTFAFEPGKGWRIGVEASWVANQVDNNQQHKPSYWFLAAMIGKEFKHVRIVLNAENLLDYRQSRVESLYTGTISQPIFKALWAPIEGRVINLSVRFSL